MIRSFLERRRARRILGKIVNPETVESLLRDDLQRQPLKHGRIEFVLAFVRGETPDQISDRVGAAADLAAEHGATVYDLIGPLVIAAFGTHPAASPQPGSRSSLVAALHERLAGDIKIVHGAADGHYGLVGSERRTSYSFLVPQFDVILGTLSRLPFGQIEEVRQ